MLAQWLEEWLIGDVIAHGYSGEVRPFLLGTELGVTIGTEGEMEGIALLIGEVGIVEQVLRVGT